MTSVLLFLLYSVTQIEHGMSESVCVLGDGLPLFISDLSYATQVIQHVKPMGGLYPVCVCLSYCVNLFFVFFCLFSFVTFYVIIF